MSVHISLNKTRVFRGGFINIPVQCFAPYSPQPYTMCVRWADVTNNPIRVTAHLLLDVLSRGEQRRIDRRRADDLANLTQ
jgi:hypothetical protein